MEIKQGEVFFYDFVTWSLSYLFYFFKYNFVTYPWAAASHPMYCLLIVGGRPCASNRYHHGQHHHEGHHLNLLFIKPNTMTYFVNWSSPSWSHLSPSSFTWYRFGSSLHLPGWPRQILSFCHNRTQSRSRSRSPRLCCKLGLRMFVFGLDRRIACPM